MLRSSGPRKLASRPTELCQTKASSLLPFVGNIELLSDDEKALVHIGKVLGSGGFGTVSEGTYRGRSVAVKKLRPNSKNPRAVLQSFQAETAIMSFCHPNIVRTLAASSSDCLLTERMIIMEFAGNCTLRNVLDNEREVIDEPRRLKYALHVAKALEFIHEHDIAHLDVKPANILVDAHDTCKLGDFGCSQIVGEGDDNLPASPTYSYLTGTFAYRAPELLKGEPPTTKADIYSLGICLWQLITRERPYGSENLYVVVFGVVAYNLRPRVPTNGVEALTRYKQLLETLWQPNPCARPSATESIRTLQNLRLGNSV